MSIICTPITKTPSFIFVERQPLFRGCVSTPTKNRYMFGVYNSAAVYRALTDLQKSWTHRNKRNFLRQSGQRGSKRVKLYEITSFTRKKKKKSRKLYFQSAFVPSWVQRGFLFFYSSYDSELRQFLRSRASFFLYRCECSRTNRPINYAIGCRSVWNANGVIREIGLSIWQNYVRTRRSSRTARSD